MNDSQKIASEWGLGPEFAQQTLARLSQADESPVDIWQSLQGGFLHAEQPFEFHQWLYDRVYGAKSLQDDPQPVWFPDSGTMETSNITRWCRRLEFDDVTQLHGWSVQHRSDFWKQVIDELQIVFRSPPSAMWGEKNTPHAGGYLPEASLNIAESCLGGDPQRLALRYEDESGTEIQWTVGELSEQVHRVAGALQAQGFEVGAAAAIMMPMTPEAVVIYLGIIWAGGAVVSIADSFAPPEIATRLAIAKTKLVFTCDEFLRSGKAVRLYHRLLSIDCPPCIVVGTGKPSRPEDRNYSQWLSSSDPRTEAIACTSMVTTNYLFSSGTTGTPKAIPWNHTTPIKCAADALFHQDVRAGDVLAWPTNLGWMMGPWLIYASLINNASMALYGGNPGSAEFCRFVERAGVTMLGVVPSLVRSWRRHESIEGCDWSAIRAFSSTGECSLPQDMFYLMSRAGFRPVIEYCGGTELGGGYLTSCVVVPSSPGVFTMPTMGMDHLLLDADGQPTDSGEAFLVPPSIGMSTTLLNRDHDEAYFLAVPTGPDGERLRRHGDLLERLKGGRYRVQGRADDTMNLGGIKIGSAEIERVVSAIDGIREAAAVAVSPAGGGPGKLVVFAVCHDPGDSKEWLDQTTETVRTHIKDELNPLFRLERLVIVDQLPRTASNKVMRRVLREQAASDSS